MRLKIYGLLMFIFWLMPYYTIAYFIATVFDKNEEPFIVMASMLLAGIFCLIVAGLITIKKGDE